MPLGPKETKKTLRSKDKLFSAILQKRQISKFVGKKLTKCISVFKFFVLQIKSQKQKKTYLLVKKSFEQRPTNIINKITAETLAWH
jgi:hypothetical protein